MTQEELDRQVDSLIDFLLKKGNQGMKFWLKSKGFSKKEENYIRISMGGSDDMAE